VNRHQIGVAKTYLWVAAALIGGYVTTYKLASINITCIPMDVIVMGILSIGSAIFAFGFCLYSIPGRSGYYKVADKNWGEFAEAAYTKLRQRDEHVYATVITGMLYKYDIAVDHNRTTNIKRAKLLSVTSWVLIFSFLLSIACISSYSYQYYKKANPNYGDIEMSEKDNNEQPKISNKNLGLTQPKVLKPEKPFVGGSGGSGDNVSKQIMTEAKDPSKIIRTDIKEVE